MRNQTSEESDMTSWVIRPPVPIVVAANTLVVAAGAATWFMFAWTYQRSDEVSGMVYGAIVSCGVVSLCAFTWVWVTLIAARRVSIDHATGQLDLRWSTHRVAISRAEVERVSLRRFQNLFWSDWFVILACRNGDQYDLGRSLVLGFGRDVPKDVSEFADKLSSKLYCSVSFDSP